MHVNLFASHKYIHSVSPDTFSNILSAVSGETAMYIYSMYTLVELISWVIELNAAVLFKKDIFFQILCWKIP